MHDLHGGGGRVIFWEDTDAQPCVRTPVALVRRAIPCGWPKSVGRVAITRFTPDPRRPVPAPAAPRVRRRDRRRADGDARRGGRVQERGARPLRRGADAQPGA